MDIRSLKLVDIDRVPKAYILGKQNQAISVDCFQYLYLIKV
jgi:hypothetical protein